MKCGACGKVLREGDQAVPVVQLHSTGRYGVQPASEPVMYIHVDHVLNTDRENGSES